jgi:hypothetical protein
VQIGYSIVQLGFQLETENEGRLACTPEKREGLCAELAEMDGDKGRNTPAAHVESTAGKLINLATVMVEGRAYMEPWYRMLNATRQQIVDGSRRRFKLGKLNLSGQGPVQRRFQDSSSWWRAALRSDISLPLAPRLAFPAVGESRCALAFQDAARGQGTGFGGFAPFVTADGRRKLMLTCVRSWPHDLQQALYTNKLSMAAGELFAFICLATAAHLRMHATHVIGMTDNDPTQAAINHCCSGRPQMQALLIWFYQMCPRLQSLAVWLPGKRNTRSDAQSRGVGLAAAVEREAASAGWEILSLPPPPHAFEILRSIADIPNSD